MKRALCDRAKSIRRTTPVQKKKSEMQAMLLCGPREGSMPSSLASPWNGGWHFGPPCQHSRGTETCGLVFCSCLPYVENTRPCHGRWSLFCHTAVRSPAGYASDSDPDPDPDPDLLSRSPLRWKTETTVLERQGPFSLSVPTNSILRKL